MALYLKHRPQTFATIVGQDHIVQTITNQIKSGKVAHAYLFSGSRGVGKTTTARLLAKALNCEKRKEKSFEPCNECSSCTEISAGRAIDVIEIDAASHTGVDNVRENIIENAQFNPTKSPYKVFIIDEVHMLSTSAFNALLKTLEEPPAYIVFILATTELHKLPETILSRCQRYNFKKVPYDILSKHLQTIAKEEKIKIDQEVLDRIINKSDGCVRDAVSLLDQIMATGEKTITAEIASIVLPASNVEETLSLVSSLVNKQAKKGLDIINKLAEDGIRFTQLADDTIELLRIMMITKATAQKSATGVDLSDKVQKELSKLNDLITNHELIRLIDLVMKRRQEIPSSPLPQLPLELVVIEWCSDNNQGSVISDQRPVANEQKSVIGNQESTTTKQSNDKNNEVIVNNSGNIFSDEKMDSLVDEITDSVEQIRVEEKIEEKTEEISKTKLFAEKVKNLIIRDKEPVCTVEDVKSKWTELLTVINGESPSLTFILKTASVESVEGNTVCISVGFSFHKDKLDGNKCRKQIEELLSKLLDKKVRIDIIVQTKKAVETEPEPIGSKEMMELASALGGEVVS